MERTSKKQKALLVSLLTASLAVGNMGMVSAADNGEQLTYNTQIIKDQYIGEAKTVTKFWQDQGILKGDTYNFDKDVVISTKYAKKGDVGTTYNTWEFADIMWSGYDPGTINLNGHKMILKASGGDVNMQPQGIYVQSETLTLDNVGGLDVETNAENNTTGIKVAGNRSRGAWWNGDGNAKLVINNDLDSEHVVKVRTNGTGSTTGIEVRKNSGTAELDIKGLVDVENNNEKGMAIWNNEGTLKLGGGTMVAEKGVAIRDNGGTTNVNSQIIDNVIQVVNPEAPVVINGDVTYNAKSTLNLALANKKSSLAGMIAQEDNLDAGTMNLLMNEGAIWNHINKQSDKYNESRISHLVSSKGQINQNSTKDIKVDRLTGETSVIYTHNNNGEKLNDFIGGKFIVNSADQGAVVNMITDSKDINLQDTSSYYKVLDNLAHKLTYQGWTQGEYNISGKLKIASGLTSSTAEIEKPITFSDATGEGTFREIARPDQTKNDFTSTITGDRKQNQEYVDQGVLYEDGNYTFRQDSTITPDANTPAIKPITDVSINDVNKDITLKVENATTDVAAIEVNDENATLITKDGMLNINVQGNKKVSGIQITNSTAEPEFGGTTNITAKGEKAYGILIDDNTGAKFKNVNIGSETEEGVVGSGNNVEDSAGIYMSGGEDAYAEGSFDGDVNIYTKNTGILLDAGGQLYFDGNTNINTSATDNRNYAIYGKLGGININGNGDADKTVQINGNIGLLPTDVIAPIINVNLLNSNSKFTGAIVNKVNERNVAMNLGLANGAVWENRVVGQVDPDYAGGLLSLNGGNSMNNAGIVHMKDSKDLKVQSLNGAINFFYDHENSGIDASDFKAGNVRINKVVTDQNLTPMVIMTTDSQGIEIGNKAKVAKVLNNLANKLYYNDNQDLYAEARISSGLTSAAQSLIKGRITFNEQKQGEYKPPTEGLSASQAIIVTGKAKVDGESQEFFETNNILDREGNYLFDQDWEITTGVKNGINSGMGKVNGGILIDTQKDNVKDITIDFNKHLVDIDATNDEKGALAFGNKAVPIMVKYIGNSTKRQKVTIKNISQLGITATAKSSNSTSANGISVTGSDLVFDNVMNTGVFLDGNTNKSTSGILVTSGGSFTNKNNMEFIINSPNPLLKTFGGKEDHPSVITIGGLELQDTKGNDLVVASDVSEINLNPEGNKTVVAKGNIKFSSSKGSVVNMQLTTKKSKWTGGSLGVDDKKTGKVNLTLNKKAVWNSQVIKGEEPTDNPYPEADVKQQQVNLLKGGIDETDTGFINRLDDKPLFIKKLDGYTTLVYEHENDGSQAEDYTAGDTIIDTASQGSGLTVVTDSKNVKMDSEEAVAITLTNLARKIIYNGSLNNEQNIEAKAVIASGLTSNRYDALVNKAMDFDKSSGRGILATPKDSNNLPIITGTAADTYYKDKNLIKDGVYTLPTEAEIITNNGKSPIIGKENLKIDASDTVLSLDNRGSYDKDVYGLESVTGVPIDIKLKELNITTRNAGGRGEGIHLKNSDLSTANIVNIDGDVNVNVHGTVYALGTYATGNSKLIINGNFTAKGAEGNPGVTKVEPFSLNDDYYGAIALYSGGDYNIQRGGTTVVNGDVDIVVGNGAGIEANGGGAKVFINGGGSVVMKPNTSVDTYTYALVAQSGHITMNMDQDGKTAGKKDVNITGNIGLLTGSVNPNEYDKSTSITLGLGTANSKFTGVVDNNFKDKEYGEGYTTNMTLGLQNGAIWDNQGVSMIKSRASKVENFIGGKDMEHRGIILQNSYMDLKLDNYQGNTQIIYQHDFRNKKINFAQYGDVQIGKAAPDSYVLLTTDNNGIEMTQDAAVKDTLQALAKKLQYANSKVDNNLKGQVSIASGLTSASQVLKIADIKFDDKNLGTLAGEIAEHDIPAIAPTDPVKPDTDTTTKPVEPGSTVTPGTEETKPGSGETTVQPSTDTSKPESSTEKTEGEKHPSGGSETKPESGDKPAKPVIKPGDVQAGDYESVIMQGVRSATTAAAENYRHLNDMALDHLGELPKEAGEYTFAKVLAGKTDFSHNGAKADGKYRGMQAGYDKVSDHGAAGVQVLYAKEKDTLATGHSDNKAVVLSAYAKKDLNDKSFFGVMGSVGRVNSDYKVANEIFTTTVKGEYKASGLGLGMVYGQRFEHKDVTITPEVSLMASRLNNSKYQATTPDGRVLNIDQQGIKSVVGKFTTRFSKATKQGSIYGRIGLAHEFAGDIKGNYSSKDGGVKATSFSGKDTWLETALGAEFKSNHGFSTNIQLAKDFAGHNHKGWNGNINFQFQF